MKLQIVIECDVDKYGMLGSSTFAAKSCKGGPVLQRTFVETTQVPKEAKAKEK